jgi:integrase
MAHVDRLTALKVKRETRPGMHHDGRGLYLCISESGARSWLFRFMLHGRRHEMGLGSAHDISLAEAREAAHQARKLKANGIDPLASKRSSRAARRAAEAAAVTFAQCAESYMVAKQSEWRSLVHARQWRQSLNDYVLPVIGTLPVAAVDTALVLKVLQPIWETKNETASRVRNRIELILDFAKVSGFRDGATNPAAWRGHLDHLLSKPSKVQRIEHYAALPYADMPQFMGELRQRQGVGARALEFLVLTAARSNEVIAATPAEFNGDVWTIPASRMKGGKEHRVPLALPALALVDAVSGRVPREAMGKALAKLRPGLTVHGFRSTFRDWTAETTSFPNHVVELALAHAIGSAVEAAYRRGDLLDKRRELMNAWGTYCVGGVR